MGNRSRVTEPLCRRAFLIGDVVVPQWQQLQHELLRQRTDQLIGPPSDSDEQPMIRFTVTQLPLPDGGITVTVDPACGLADVHDLCTWVARACLDDDHRVVFTRAAPIYETQGSSTPATSEPASARTAAATTSTSTPW